jgi:hypothetical protein
MTLVMCHVSLALSTPVVGNLGVAYVKNPGSVGTSRQGAPLRRT